MCIPAIYSCAHKCLHLSGVHDVHVPAPCELWSTHKPMCVQTLVISELVNLGMPIFVLCESEASQLLLWILWFLTANTVDQSTICVRQWKRITYDNGPILHGRQMLAYQTPFL